MSELENVKVVLNYLNTVEDNEGYQKRPSSFNEWLESEKERLNKEYFDLSVANAEDSEIISQALIEMSNKYRTKGQFKAYNKVDEVRKRFLDNKTEKFVKTNLNLYIKVKLNDYGRQIHDDYWRDICRDANVLYELEVDEEGYTSFQIHKFMNLFGEYAHLGAKPFLETNDVLIERSEK